MVIAVFYATVTDATVGGARRSPETARGTVFGGDIRRLWGYFGMGCYREVAGRGEKVPTFSWLGREHVEIAREDLKFLEQGEW